MKKQICSLFLLTLLLGSCSLTLKPGNSVANSNNGGDGSSSKYDDPSSSIKDPNSSTTNPSSTVVTPPSSTTGESGKFLEEYTNTLRDTNESIGWHTMQSTGTQKVLVVPVRFSDGPTWTSAMLSNLQLAFFGEAKYTNWQSVKTFFAQSSYGKVDITGEVYDSVLEVSMSTSSFNTRYNTNSTTYDPGKYIGDLFYNKASANYSKLQEYDQDGDGYLDAVIFCYSNDFSTSDNSVYWAWCSYTDNDGNKLAPTINNYMWVSYKFMDDSYSGVGAPSGIDAHTFIHEMGHILGLDDYYCYDDYSYDGVYPWNCAGELDMQSFNVGDHNIYSKFSLGWVDPIWVKESTTINLRSSALYGDAILINDSWNGTIFDEYLLIEYYTPEGNNYQDSKYYFDSRDLMYTASGLRIYHVDARMVKLTNQGRFVSYANTQDEMVSTLKSSTYCGYIGASNSQSWSYLNSNKDKDRLLHLIDKGGNNTLSKGISGSDSYGTYVNRTSALWTTGSTFKPTKSFFMSGDNKFNDGSTIGYTISVGSIKDGAISVTITKN